MHHLLAPEARALQPERERERERERREREREREREESEKARSGGILCGYLCGMNGAKPVTLPKMPVTLPKMPRATRSKRVALLNTGHVISHWY